MRLLLDTHIFLWWQLEPDRIDAEVRQRIEDADACFVSIASAWETAIKQSLGRLEIPDTFEHGLKMHGFTPLPITLGHTEIVRTLPLIHGDPFDRMLIAQAMGEGLTFVTRDRALSAYDIPLILT